MRNLLSANFSRLWKDKIFWLCVIGTLLLAAVTIYNGAETAASMAGRGHQTDLDDYYFELAPYIGAVMAVFISLFLGTEYSDGTIRNKLIVGHTRTNIYLANFLTCLAGSVIITAAWFIGGLPGIWLIGDFAMGLPGVIAYFFVAVGIAAAFSGIFVWVSTLSRNKAITVVVVLVLWVAMVLVGSGLNDRLREPEFNGGMAMINGAFIMMEDTPNPLYLSGGVRVAAEWLYKLLPAGQAIAMTDAEITTPGLNIAASVIVTVAVTAAGILSFRKKDLK